MPPRNPITHPCGATPVVDALHCLRRDDDDIYAPGRLRAQIAPLVGGVDLTVLEHTHTYFMAADELFVADGMPWKAAASFGPCAAAD